MQFDTSMLSCKYGQKGEGIYSEAADVEEPKCSAFRPSDSTYPQAYQKEPNFPQTDYCSDTTRGYMQMQAEDKVGWVLAYIVRVWGYFKSAFYFSNLDGHL